MVTWISAERLEEKLGTPPFTVIDPRSPMRYLSGHLKGSINIPFKLLYGPEGRLRSEEKLANAIGSAGLGDDDVPIIYDGQDGRNDHPVQKAVDEAFHHRAAFIRHRGIDHGDGHRQRREQQQEQQATAAQQLFEAEFEDRPHLTPHDIAENALKRFVQGLHAKQSDP